MNNKNEKTFADLFSSSTSEIKDDTQTFSNIFSETKEDENDNKENQSEPKESTNAITFDNIADRISTTEEEPPVEFDIFKKAITEEKEETTESHVEEPQMEEEKQEETSKEETKVSFEDIFAKPISSSSVEETSEETINSDTLEKDNPFFTEESTLEESHQEEITSSLDNPFFTESKAEEETTKEIENEANNPFFVENEANKETVEENIQKEEKDNPFFMEEPTEIPAEDKQPELSPKVPEEKIKEETNLFFTTGESSNESKEQTIEETKEEIPTSSSPFFAEESKEDSDNPFFQGQLNLIENNQHNNPVGNIDISKTKHFDVKIVKKKEPLIKFILGVFSYAIFIFLLLIGITLLIYVVDIKLRAAKGDYSAPTFNAYVVLTGSMLPEIAVSDVVITKKIDAADLKEGDVITFASADSRFQGTIITHRIIKKNPPSGDNGYTFQTRGDNNNVADSALVPESNIFGKVILKIPKLGYLQEFLASDGGWIIVILIPCLTVISYDVVKLAKGLKRKKYKNIKVQK